MSEFEKKTCEYCLYENRRVIDKPCVNCLNEPFIGNSCWVPKVKKKPIAVNNCTTCCYADLNSSPSMCIPCMQKALTVGEYPNWAALKFNGVSEQIRQEKTEKTHVWWDTYAKQFVFIGANVKDFIKYTHPNHLIFVQEVTYTHGVES